MVCNEMVYYEINQVIKEVKNSQLSNKQKSLIVSYLLLARDRVKQLIV